MIFGLKSGDRVTKVDGWQSVKIFSCTLEASYHLSSLHPKSNNKNSYPLPFSHLERAFSIIFRARF